MVNNITFKYVLKAITLAKNGSLRKLNGIYFLMTYNGPKFYANSCCHLQPLISCQ